MICEKCKEKIKKEESFEEMTNRILRETRMKLQKECNWGIPDTKEKQWKKRKH